MAEFCLECWNRVNEAADGPEKYVSSKQPEFCEGCRQQKPVIVALRWGYRLRQWRKRLLAHSRNHT